MSVTTRIGGRGVATRCGQAIAALVALLSLWLPCVARAAGTDIAILLSSDITAYRDAAAGLKAAGPSAAAYTEYDLQGDLELGKKLARKIRASDPSLVLAVGLKATLAAKLEIIDTPIVYMMLLDPLKHRLTAPNMTGTMLEIPIDRQLKLIRSFLPAARRVGILYDPKRTASKIKDVEQSAVKAGIEVRAYPVDTEKDVPSQLRALLSTTDLLWLLPDSTVLTNESINFVLESALAQRVPVIGFSSEFTRLGALLGFSVNYGEVGRETGLLAKRILNGDRINPLKPVPIERLKVSINLKTARFLDISLPSDLNGLIDETY